MASEYRVKVFDPELKQEVDSFNPTLSIGGWCVLLFAVLHFYPPIAFLYPKRNEDKTEPGDALTPIRLRLRVLVVAGRSAKGKANELTKDFKHDALAFSCMRIFRWNQYS